MIKPNWKMAELSIQMPCTKRRKRSLSHPCQLPEMSDWQALSFHSKSSRGYVYEAVFLL